MLLQIGLNVLESTIYIKQKTKEIASKTSMFLKNSIYKYSAINTAAKMASVFLVLAFVPLVPQASNDSYKATVKLDTNSTQIVVGRDRKVAVNTTSAIVDAPKSGSTRVAYAAEPEGVQFYIDTYKRAAAQYGIPWQVLAAVHYVESGASGSTNVTSYAGAQGPMQFMPGTWRAYGVDANGDGTADAHNVTDAIYGAANLLAAGGAAEGNVDGALLNYNHAQWYVDKVNEVASSIQ